MWLCWVLCFMVSVEVAETSQCQPELESHLKPQLGKDLSGPKHMWLLAEFSFLWPIGLTRSLPWCLLVWGCPQFLATWASLIRPLALSKRANQEDKRKVAISCNVITEMTSHQFCHLLLLRSSHRPRSQLRGMGMDYTGRDISTRRRGNWGPL